MDFGIPRNKVWISTVNSDWEFLGIPNRNNSGSKNLEILRNSQKFPEIPSYSQQDLELLGITTQSSNDFPWKAVNLKNS